MNRIISRLAQFKRTIFVICVVSLALCLGRALTFFLLAIHLVALIPGASVPGVNVLVVGTDSVDGTQRSDVISVVHFNQDHASVRVLAIPRDTRVTIDGVGVSKINHAYAHGGVSLLKKTVSQFLSIPIHHHVVVDTGGLMQLIDTLGGVKVTIDKPMKYDDFAGDLHIDFPKGVVHLSGEDVVKYIRFRNDANGDIGRIQRQQQVMDQLLDQVFNLRSLVVSPKLITIFLSSVKTDISFKKAAQWVHFLTRGTRPIDIMFSTVPGSIRLIEGVSYWRPNIVYLDSLITKTFMDYGETVSSAGHQQQRPLTSDQIQRVGQQLLLDTHQNIDALSPMAIEVLNGNGISGLAVYTADVLRSYQLDVPIIDNSESFEYKDTIIVDWKGNLDKSMKLAQLLAIDPSNIVVYDRQDKPLDITLVLGKDWSEDRVRKLGVK
jgi:LCP family protein required for cell wall assembly